MGVFIIHPLFDGLDLLFDLSHSDAITFRPGLQFLGVLNELIYFSTEIPVTLLLFSFAVYSGDHIFLK